MDRAVETRKFVEKVEILNNKFVLPEKSQKHVKRFCTFNVHQLRAPLPVDFTGIDTADMVGNILRNMHIDVAFLQEFPSDANLIKNVFPFYDVDAKTQLAIGSWFPLTKLHASTYMMSDMIVTNVHLDVRNPIAAFRQVAPILSLYKTQKNVVAGDFNSSDAVNWMAPLNLHRRPMGATCWAGTEIDFIFTNMQVEKSFVAPVTVSDHLPVVYDIKEF